MFRREEEDIVSLIREILNNEEEILNNKTAAEDILDGQELPPISNKAHDLLTKLSNSSLTWGNLFNAIEDLRKNFRSAGSLDSTADQRQIGMASVLLVLFELVVQTNLRIQPVDVNIVINTMADNFTSKNQIEALQELLEKLNLK